MARIKALPGTLLGFAKGGATGAVRLAALTAFVGVAVLVLDALLLDTEPPTDL